MAFPRQSQHGTPACMCHASSFPEWAKTVGGPATKEFDHRAAVFIQTTEAIAPVFSNPSPARSRASAEVSTPDKRFRAASSSRFMPVPSQAVQVHCPAPPQRLQELADGKAGPSPLANASLQQEPRADIKVATQLYTKRIIVNILTLSMRTCVTGTPAALGTGPLRLSELECVRHDIACARRFGPGTAEGAPLSLVACCSVWARGE